MQSILLRCHSSEQEELITELWLRGTLGILEEPPNLRAFFDDYADLIPFAARMIQIRHENPLDASEFSKDDWDPICVGNRFWIAPSWIDQPTPPGRLRLPIDNPTAFGTGRHETTQLALEALEQYVTPESTVLDIGSGSGILSQAALLLGASRIFSCDIHADAIRTSAPHLGARIFLGSADAIKSAAGDLVIANISTKVIDRLSWELNRITRSNGLLILSGFIRDNPPQNFSPEKVTERGDWLCWLCRPSASVSDELPPFSHVHSPDWW